MRTITFDETKWKLVPVEPTESMISAYLDCQDTDPEDALETYVYDGYKAMLDAAPTYDDGGNGNG